MSLASTAPAPAATSRQLATLGLGAAALALYSWATLRSRERGRRDARSGGCIVAMTDTMPMMTREEAARALRGLLRGTDLGAPSVSFVCRAAGALRIDGVLTSDAVVQAVLGCRGVNVSGHAGGRWASLADLQLLGQCTPRWRRAALRLTAAWLTGAAPAPATGNSRAPAPRNTKLRSAALARLAQDWRMFSDAAAVGEAGRELHDALQLLVLLEMWHDTRVPWLELQAQADALPSLACALKSWGVRPAGSSSCSSATGASSARACPPKARAGAEKIAAQRPHPSAFGGSAGGCTAAKPKQPKQAKTQEHWERYRGDAIGRCAMLSLDGSLLCECDARKIDWYVSNGLANELEARRSGSWERVARLTVALSLAERKLAVAHEYRCVGCGGNDRLRAFYIVPRGFSKYFPLAVKRDNNHDQAWLCQRCFGHATEAASAHRTKVLHEAGLGLAEHRGVKFERDKRLQVLARNALALRKPSLPLSRVAELRKELQAFFEDVAFCALLGVGEQQLALLFQPAADAEAALAQRAALQALSKKAKAVPRQAAPNYTQPEASLVLQLLQCGVRLGCARKQHVGDTRPGAAQRRSCQWLQHRLPHPSRVQDTRCKRAYEKLHVLFNSVLRDCKGASVFVCRPSLKHYLYPVSRYWCHGTDAPSPLPFGVVRRRRGKGAWRANRGGRAGGAAACSM